MKLTNEHKKLLLLFQKQELTGSIIYRKLAKKQKDKHNSAILNRIADDELEHYNTIKKITDRDEPPNSRNIFIYNLLSYFPGLTFGIKLMEKNEMNDQVLYEKLAFLPGIPPIIEDEEKHEKALVKMINEDKLNYMGSIVLGLNDALVELTGALAGFTFALQNPGLVALTGSITGIAAALSMAASEYLSTKSEDTERHALRASVYTGITYIATVIILILPFLIIGNIYVSLTVTLAEAIAIIAAFNYYYSVVKDKKFIRRFAEMAGLSLSVALLSFGFGYLIRHFFNIET